MYTIYTIGKNQEVVDTGLGHEVEHEALKTAINLAGQYVALTQKDGRRATVEATEYNDMFVVKIVGRDKILAAYAVKKDIEMYCVPCGYGQRGKHCKDCGTKLVKSI